MLCSKVGRHKMHNIPFLSRAESSGAVLLGSALSAAKTVPIVGAGAGGYSSG